jgi:HSP20 family protein
MFTSYRNGSMVPAEERNSNRLSSLLDHFFHNDFFTPAGTPAPTTVLPLSVWEDEQKVYVELDAPGVSEKDFDITLHDGVLTIRTERKSTAEGRFDTRTYGRFEQRITLPNTVDENAVAANLANGVLSLTIAKVPEAKPRKIEVSVQANG